MIRTVPALRAGATVVHQWPPSADKWGWHQGRVSASGSIKVEWLVDGRSQRVTFLAFGQDEMVCPRSSTLEVRVTNKDGLTGFNVYIGGVEDGADEPELADEPTERDSQWPVQG